MGWWTRTESAESAKSDRSSPSDRQNSQKKPYRERTPLETRKVESAMITQKYPHLVPVVVEKFRKEKVLPELKKTKFLAPRTITISQFMSIIRNRMSLSGNQTLYLLINNRAIVSMTLTMDEVYKAHHSEDGFLYVTYASQEIFG